MNPKNIAANLFIPVSRKWPIQHAWLCLKLMLIPLFACVSAESAIAAEPWPLGKLTTDAGTPGNGPEGYEISGFEVTCPGVEKSMHGFLAVAPHRGTARGLVVFFTGGGGFSWWASDADAEDYALAEELRDNGFTIVQVKWKGTWHHSSPGDDAGTAHLGCRPATVIKHIHEKYYLPLGVKVTEPGQAGFCITGNSGGASQVGYALSHYGLDNILDLVIPSGGPPHSVLAKSMLEPSGDRQGYGYPEGTRGYIDKSFGYFDGTGPGKRQDATFKQRWEEESIATGGNDYNHPKTRVHFIIGQGDRGMQTVGRDYYDRLKKEGSPMVEWVLAPNTKHNISAYPQGRDALKAAILGTQAPSASVSPTTKPAEGNDKSKIDRAEVGELMEKAERGEELTAEEQAYLDRARRQQDQKQGGSDKTKKKGGKKSKDEGKK